MVLEYFSTTEGKIMVNQGEWLTYFFLVQIELLKSLSHTHPRLQASVFLLHVGDSDVGDAGMWNSVIWRSW